jgi:hypothetical protein
MARERRGTSSLTARDVVCVSRTSGAYWRFPSSIGKAGEDEREGRRTDEQLRHNHNRLQILLRRIESDTENVNEVESLSVESPACLFATDTGGGSLGEGI